MADFILFQSRSFLAFFSCGLFAAALFDLMRILRKLITHNTFFITLEDIVFWLMTGAAAFIFLYRFQSGSLRLFLILGFFFGVLIWLTTLGRVFMGPLCRLLLYFKKQLLKGYRKIYSSRKPSRQTR